MYLGWIDYIVLFLVLGLSAGIGIYHGCIGSKQSSIREYLMADGRMAILPTAMSLLASFRSAASLLGIPVEYYLYGNIRLIQVLGGLIGACITTTIFIPKFRQIGSVSIYAYLEQRFSLSVRIVVTCTFILGTILYMGVILYGPSLALSQVSGLSIWLAVVSCGLVCTIYTSIGGIKAVIWTDVVQTVMMLMGIIASIIFGFMDVGEITKTVKTMFGGDRYQLLNFTFDPSIRYSVWTMVIGYIFFDVAMYACTQTQAQRYMCVKDTKAAQRVVWINYAMNIVMQILFLCIGCLIYVKYSQCDPIKAKFISKTDQLYPFFVMETSGKYPGFAGLFIASILSASLSTISSGINSMATVIIEDIYKRLPIARTMSNERQATISKLLSVGIGLLTIFLAFITSFVKNNIIAITFQLIGVFTAPILGIYLLGFFTARVKSRSALIAFILSLIFQLWILIGSTLRKTSSNRYDGSFPTSIAGCIPSVNITIPISKNEKRQSLISLYSIAPTWFTFNGTIITIILGLIFSFIFDSKDSKTIDKSLLVPRNEIFPCCLSKKETKKRTQIENYDGMETNNTIIEQESMLNT